MGGVRKAFQEVGPAPMNKCLRTKEYSVLQIVGVVGTGINSGRGEVCQACGLRSVGGLWWSREFGFLLCSYADPEGLWSSKLLRFRGSKLYRVEGTGQ